MQLPLMTLHGVINIPTKQNISVEGCESLLFSSNVDLRIFAATNIALKRSTDVQVLAEDAVGDLDQQVPVPIPHITSTVPCTVYDQTIDVQPVNRPTDQNSEPVVNQLDKNIMCMYIYCDLYIYIYIHI